MLFLRFFNHGVISQNQFGVWFTKSPHHPLSPSLPPLSSEALAKEDRLPACSSIQYLYFYGILSGMKKTTLLFTDALKLKRPNAFQVMLKPAGPACNLDCNYCYYLEKSKLFGGGSTRMSDELLEEFTKQFIEAHDVPVVMFTWQGGEPTLMGLDFFRKTVALQKKYSGGKQIENAFQTNGTLLNDEWCAFLRENNMLVGISIDGPEQVHDHYRRSKSGAPTFKRVMKGIELLQKHKVEFNTLSVVNDFNVSMATETYRFLKQIGSGFIQFLPVVERISESQSEHELKLVAPVHGEAKLAPWTVESKDYGKFLITIFNEWVRNDVARYYVQIFDATLANYVGENPGICVFNETCGDALAMEHNGDVYPAIILYIRNIIVGNIFKTPLIDLVKSQQSV